jgi:hypothetical protein
MPDATGPELAARLESAAGSLLALVEGLPASLITWKPADEVWSVMEILCHVQEFVPYWTGQASQMAAAPEQLWGRDHRDAGRLAAVAAAHGRRLPDVTAAIRATVRESAAAIASMRDHELATEAVSRNPRWGRKPASFVIDDLVIQHVEKHLGQVRRNLAQFEASGIPGNR